MGNGIQNLSIHGDLPRTPDRGPFRDLATHPREPSRPERRGDTYALMSRIAFVTGGARGIGAAIAQTLAADGHKVAVADIRDELAQETARSIDGLAVHADLTSSASVSEAIAQTEQQLGPIEVLVNN